MRPSFPQRADKALTRNRVHDQFGGQKTAVLIDGSALYLAARNLYEGRQLNYHAIVNLLTERVQGLTSSEKASADHWVMWTSASPENTGQSRFLDFVEEELKWKVRRFTPTESYLIDPIVGAGLTVEMRNRLLRFDASIGFAIGRLCENHRIVLVTDSFALAEPMVRAARLKASSSKNVLAFFGRALDARWQSILRRGIVDSIDFDEAESEFFGIQQKEDRTPSDESFVF